ncbi:hypothetical protein [Phenylobacterium sp.]|uniref:hypothetical protein n=1 Tax=Phenylobacterium sp. TaxID=1871053 RepID=UPI002FC9694A
MSRLLIGSRRAALLYGAPAAAAAAPLAAPVSIGTASQNSGVGTTLAKTLTDNVAIGDLVVVFGSSSGSQSISAITDTQGHTYTQATSQSNGASTWRNRIYFTIATAAMTSGVDSVTLTWGSSTGYKQIHIFKASGILGPTASALDKAASATTASGNPTTTTATLAQARCLAMAFTIVITGVGETITDNGSWAALTDGAAGGSALAAIHAAWYETAATTAVTHAPTLSNTARETNTHVAVFKGA